MKFVKKALGIMMILIFSISLLGCNNSIKKEVNKKKVVINVMTDINNEELIEYLDYFNAEYPDINIKTTFMPAEKAKETIRKQKENFDVFLGYSILDALEFEKEQMLYGYKPKDFNIIKEDFKDTKNNIPKWTGISGYSLGIANKKSKENMLKGDILQNIIKKDFYKDIVLTDPTTSSAGYLLLEYIYETYGEAKAKDIFKALKENSKIIEDYPYNVGRLVNDDKVNLAITTDYSALISKLDDFEIDMHYINEEAPPYNIEVVALLNNDKIKNESKIFIDFITGEKTRGLYKKNRDILVDNQKTTLEGANKINISKKNYEEELKIKKRVLELWKEIK